MDILLYVYDLSYGLARQMSVQLLGFYVDAVFHTSIVIDGHEYFYGSGGGIQTCLAGRAPYGNPINIISLGKTTKSSEEIQSHLSSMRVKYAGAAYDLFQHNCNHFSNDFAQFLVNRNIPENITNLPRQVLESPFGRMLQQQINLPIPRGVPVQNSHGPSVPVQTTQGTPQASHPHTALDVPQVIGIIPFVSYADKPDIATMTARLYKIDSSTLPKAISAISNVDVSKEIKLSASDVRNIMSATHQMLPSTQSQEAVAMLDLLKLLLVDSRISMMLSNDMIHDSLPLFIFSHLNEIRGGERELNLAALKLACNYFLDDGLRESIFRSPTAGALVQFLSEAILNTDDLEIQDAAAILALNVTTEHFNHIHIQDSPGTALLEASQVELAVAILEALKLSASIGPVRNLVLAFGRLMYKASSHEDLIETCKALEGGNIIKDTEKVLPADDHDLVKQVLSLLEG